MKHTLILAFLLWTTFSSFSQDKKEMNAEVTTYYFIRHAEKDRSDAKEKNPHLNADGLKRAEHWSSILGKIHFDAVYSTDYYRTKETAQPTADKNNLSVLMYQPQSNTVIEEILKNTKGKTVLIVGHSNTIPSFVNAVIGQKKYEDIDDNNNGNLYIVTIIGDTIADQVLTIN